MTISKSSQNMQTFQAVEGLEDRITSVVHQAPKETKIKVDESDKKKIFGHVIFFPGDVQDFRESMKVHPQNKDWTKWCYENTIDILSEKFPNSHIWLVMPKKKMYQIFSIFSNFIKIESLVGVPTHTTDFKGFIHLEHLMSNLVDKVCANNTENINILNSLPIVLIGFSKGCNVLNQFVYEMSNCTSDKAKNDFSHLIPSRQFIERINGIYWLDGGHSGDKDVWITDKEILSSLKCPYWSSTLQLFIHVTPYQIKDPVHPWKGEEERKFVDILKELNLNYIETIHFDKDFEENERPSLDDHFNVLSVF